MKSIVEEGSSIAKAIEKAWERAGKPQEFSVKIFEEPLKNFIGMTSKPAKVGVVFNDNPVLSTANSTTSKRSAPREQSSRYVRPQGNAQLGQQQQRSTPRYVGPYDSPSASEKEQSSHVSSPDNTFFQQKEWSEEMINFVKNWVQECLKILEMPNIEIETQASGNSLRILLSAPIVDVAQRERSLLRTFSYLASESLRTQYRQEARSLRLTITRNLPPHTND